MRWCRLYNETPSDPKLRRIAHQAGTTVANVLAVWVSMLCCATANEGEAWGTLDGWDDLDVAINLGLDRSVVGAIRREMQHRVILENRIIKWDARQSRNDHSAERMRQYRARKTSGKQDVSDDVTSRSVTVTQSDGKKRREEKRETGLRLSSAQTASRGSRLPPEWTPSPEDAGFAAGLGLDPDNAAAEFRDYWFGVPGAKGVKLDWSATFRNSCRMQAKHARPNRKPEPERPWWLEDMLNERSR